MNKHLEILLGRLDDDDIDFNSATERDSETCFIIFQSWDDRDKFVDMAKEYINEPETPDYEIEREFDCELVFDDEYTTCSDCSHIIRTSPSHYGWQPSFYMGDGFIVCKDCFDDNGYIDDYLEEKINSPKNAINGLVDEEQLRVRGFRKANDGSYENGFHRGQTDDPEVIYEDLRESWDEVVFIIDSTGQFDINFSAWVRNERDIVGR